MAKDNRGFFKSKNTWSEIKDLLLGCYLRPYFQKIVTNNEPICYVDCFAGQGKFDDGKDGSPLIALRVRDTCLTSNGNGKIEICFIELNHAEKLSENIAGFNNGYGHPTVISGKYEEKIENFLSGKRGFNVFLYIDPYGIRALDYGLFEKFNTYGFHSLEMLINFNSFGFFRDACRAMGVGYTNDEALRNLDDLVEYDPTEITSSPQSTELLCRIAGGDYWKEIVTKFKRREIDGYKAERMFSAAYKSALKKRFRYVLDMPIRLKSGQRPKYRMIHVCNHADGCYLMAENMQRRKDELFFNIQQGCQRTLFDSVDTMTSTIENEYVTIDDVGEKLSDYIFTIGGEVRLKELLAGFVNEHGLLCDFKMLHAILEKMGKNNQIDIIRIPAHTSTGKPSVFWEEKGDKKVLIRRRQA